MLIKQILSGSGGKTEMYADCFGFTEEEVFNALDEYGMCDKRTEVKKWYDGFFGKYRDIYNPWSIINYLKTGRLFSYWANTSSNGLVDKLIREGSSGIKISMENLLKGEHLYKEIDEQIIFDQLEPVSGQRISEGGKLHVK